ncbi:hypothetical protein Bhyg_09585 [Pseudolycoriella hygida]|uniref:Uncharacterized protein n=1 Tax=Pseudolycoriella hygida TaxID=35572 RepID=A0A9Q0N8A7_9DIPT|nr:hypothetical protein Bhyg_09585 [Pseudolycoriella hygida]
MPRKKKFKKKENVYQLQFNIEIKIATRECLVREKFYPSNTTPSADYNTGGINTHVTNDAMIILH